MAEPMPLEGEWHDLAVAAIREIAAEGRPFTADDLRGKVPPHPGKGHCGAAFAAALEAGLIEEVGYVKSRSPSRRGGRCLLYRKRTV